MVSHDKYQYGMGFSLTPVVFPLATPHTPIPTHPRARTATPPPPPPPPPATATTQHGANRTQVAAPASGLHDDAGGCTPRQGASGCAPHHGYKSQRLCPASGLYNGGGRAAHQGYTKRVAVTRGVCQYRVDQCTRKT